MATFVTDQDGQIAIDLMLPSGDRMSFKIGAMDGVAFPPSREVEIPDDRLNTVIAKLGAGFGFGPEHRVWGSTAG